MNENRAPKGADLMEYLSVSGYALVVGRSQSSVRQWIREGKLAGVLETCLGHLIPPQPPPTRRPR